MSIIKVALADPVCLAIGAGCLTFVGFVAGHVVTENVQPQQPESMCDAYYIATHTITDYARDYWLVESVLAGCDPR